MDSLNKLYSPLLSWRSVGLDALVLGALFAGVNGLFFPGDIGIFELNPTPAVLLPVILGLRYGFAVGAGFGALLSGGILLLRSATGEGSFESLWQGHLYAWLALPLAGGICGQFFSSVRLSLEKAQVYNQHQNSKLRALGADLEHFRQVRDRLERLLLRRDTLVFSFDNEIRSLHSVPQESFSSAFLQALSRTERIYSAAVYFREEAQYEIEGALGDPEKFPRNICGKDDAMVAEVLKTGAFAALPRFLGKEDPQAGASRFLAVFPLGSPVDSLPDGLLLIEGLPFIEFERNTLRRIDTFCRWVAQVIEQRRELKAHGSRELCGHPGQVVVSEEVLSRRIRLASWTYESLQVPYTLLLIKPSCSMAAAEFESVIGQSLRFGDTFSQIKGSLNFVLLAPFTGERAAESIQERLKASWASSGLEASSLNLRLWNNDIRETEQILKEVREAAE
jgi:hypothetical protein